jgi:hypothetical protein
VLDRFFFHGLLEEDEEVVVIVHKHWMLGLFDLFWPTLSFACGWVVLYFAPFSTVFYGVSIWATGSLVWWIRNFFDYYLDAWVVTDHGVTDLEWHGWFHRTSTRILYSDIEGVTYEIEGFLGTVLTYGTVSVEKISSGSVIELESVKNPRAIQRVILKNMENYIHSRSLKDSRYVQDILADMIAQQLQLQDTEDEYEEEEDDEYVEVDD